MKMRSLTGFKAIIILLVLGLMTPATGAAGVNARVFVPLPELFIPAPPALIVVPGTYIYYPPDIEMDLLFYHGYWYRPYRGGWYIAGGYNGPWRAIGPRRVPRGLINVLPTYRRMAPGHERLPHGLVQKNWRTWEKERHWDKPGEKRGERDGRGGAGREQRHNEGKRGRE